MRSGGWKWSVTVGTALAGLAGCAAARDGEPVAPADQAAYLVQWSGEMRSVHRDGDARPRIALAGVVGGPGAFALGPVAGLRGEITVVDGEAFVSTVVDGRATVERRTDVSAPFLVYGRVDRWMPMDIPEDVHDAAALEAWLPTVAMQRGLDASRPFPFKIETAESRVVYHVLANPDPGDRITRPHGELARSFEVDDEPLVMMGVYSTAHGGVFTHAGEAMHVHVATADGSRSGHVDAMYLGRDATLYLPAP